jgi:hypothetical protein
LLKLREKSQEQPIYKPFRVEITETLQKVVAVKAKSQEEAEQIVADSWHKCKYILSAADFAGVEFAATEAEKEERGATNA